MGTMSRIWLRLKSDDGVHHLVVDAESSVGDLRSHLLEEHPEWEPSFELFYRNRILSDEDIVNLVIDPADANPAFEVRFQSEDGEEEEDEEETVSGGESLNNHSKPREINKGVYVSILETKHFTQAKTIGELRAFANHLARDHGQLLEDLLFQNQSLMSFGSQILIEDLLIGTREPLFIAIVRPLTSWSNPPFFAASTTQDYDNDRAGKLLENIFDAQAERDRINHISQMAYNSKLISTALLSLFALVEEKFPELQEELLRVVQLNQDATDLMRKAVAEHAFYRSERPDDSFRLGSPSAGATMAGSERSFGLRGNLDVNSSISVPFSGTNPGAQVPQAAAPPNAQQQPQQHAQNPQRDVAPRLDGAAGVAARVPRMAAMVVIDVRLLFKLFLIVAVLGHDAGQTEFYTIVFVAVLVYIANTNMIRLPMLDHIMQGGLGRIPRAERRGFFIDMWTMISSFILSILPTWRVVAEDPPANQVRPVEANQPQLAAGAPAVI